MNEPSYFGLTNDHTWLSIDEKLYKKLKPTHRMKCYTHPAKEQELLDEIEALKKQVVIWERSSKDRAIKLNICAIKVSELEKKLDTRTKELIGASFYEHDYKTMMVLDGNRVYPTVKELTDEEISEVYRGFRNETASVLDVGFAKAILRKAQEK